eukprot:SAG22_NODE_13234_length_413_cov_1.095541_1_plen_72_part_10
MKTDDMHDVEPARSPVAGADPGTGTPWASPRGWQSGNAHDYLSLKTTDSTSLKYFSWYDVGSGPLMHFTSSY